MYSYLENEDLVSVPRNRGLIPAQTVPGRKAGKWSAGVEVGPPSDVTIRVKSSLSREGDLGPQVVLRCLLGEQVFQIQIAGRVASVGGARLGRGVQARALQGSGELVRVCGWHRTRNDDERADG